MGCVLRDTINFRKKIQKPGGRLSIKSSGLRSTHLQSIALTQIGARVAENPSKCVKWFSSVRLNFSGRCPN